MSDHRRNRQPGMRHNRVCAAARIRLFRTTVMSAQLGQVEIRAKRGGSVNIEDCVESDWCPEEDLNLHLRT